jgi:hypothetical protein
MTVIPAMPSFVFDRLGPFAEVDQLGLAFQVNLRGLGYGR